MTLSYSAVDTVKKSVSARMAAEALGLEVNRSGFCRCPIHGDTNESMKLYPGNRGWYCYGCHAGGSAIDLVMEVNSMGFQDAVQWLNNAFRLGLDSDRQTSRKAERKARLLAECRRVERENEAIADRILENMYGDLGLLVADLERQVAETRPKTPDEPMTRAHRDAVELLTLARETARDIAVDMTYIKRT